MKINLPSTKQVELSDDLIKKIKDKLSKMDPPEFFWDYRDELSEEQINDILTKENGVNDIENEIFEHNYDHVYDLEMEHLIDALGWFKSEIEKELGEDVELKDVAEQLRDEMLDYLTVDVNIKDLISRSGNVPCRVTLWSNYDCLNSNWFESVATGGYTYDGYFKQILDVLYLNPRKVKEMFAERGIATRGYFPNKKRREGKEYVDYKQFAIEMENNSCGATNLSIVCMLDLSEVVKNGMPKKFIIPKGNNMGMYSSFQGGGSMIECPLLRDMKIDTTKTFESEYDHFSLIPDTKEHGYTMKNDVYGVTDDFFGDEITIIP